MLASHAVVEGLGDVHRAGGKTTGEEEHGGEEDSDDGEWEGEHAPTPDSGCLLPSTLQEDALVGQPTAERTALVEAVPTAPSPSQKKSKKAPKSPVKVLLSFLTFWTVMGVPAHGLPDISLPLTFP